MVQFAATAHRPSTISPSDGSRTITITPTPAHEDDSRDDSNDRGEGGSNTATVGALKLRAGKKNTQRVVWGDDVVDNEGCGKKKSKICCIYRKPKRFDESSSDESDTDTDSDSSHSHSNRNHDHNHDHANRERSDDDGGSSTVHKIDDGYSSEPNAYERMPGWKGRGKGKQKANA
ncbi:hypothetical protein AX16_004927 [Volvariella volvacea WC 439]|nr:hypothetical protein AX16_004927 [Volvariella volvacea WC 439]